MREGALYRPNRLIRCGCSSRGRRRPSPNTNHCHPQESRHSRRRPPAPSCAPDGTVRPRSITLCGSTGARDAVGQDRWFRRRRWIYFPGTLAGRPALGGYIAHQWDQRHLAVRRQNRGVPEPLSRSTRRSSLAPAMVPGRRPRLPYTSNRRGPRPVGPVLEGGGWRESPKRSLWRKGCRQPLPADWSPDGRFVLYAVGRGPTGPAAGRVGLAAWSARENPFRSSRRDSTK